MTTDTLAPPAAPTGRLLVGGTWRETATRFAVRDKYDGRRVAEVCEAGAAEVDAAVAGAAAAFAKGAPPPTERAAILRRTAGILARERPLLMATLVAEAGLTLAEAKAEIDRSLATLEITAEETTRINGELVPFGGAPGQESRIGFTLMFPLGIVCAITPFNSPLNTVIHKVAPAFAAGNAVILKPSVYTPLAAEILCRAMVEAGVPEGFLSLLQGPGSRLGTLLLDQPDIAFYAFTGSTAVGRTIHKAAGLRRCQLELGSIAATIVCADADISRAAQKVAAAGFRKAGQVCTSVQLLLVERAAMADMRDALLERVAAISFGNPHLPTTGMGPLIDEADAARVSDWVREAETAGARVLCGGGRTRSVVEPTLLEDVARGMKVVDREVFGPLVSLVPFDSLDAAIDLANASPYGLAAGVFTRDMSRALSAARHLRFGAVHLNEASSARSDAMPFGGVKDSGFGREGPRYAIAEMSEERLITLNP
ncbi:aldehyde dehydrogenase family protein [Aquabacter spiritensis]|uniref:Succinate-semialdehyde dehydrogenase/glutarate-semialdehyde dehydrogenase n=1 Tax=Aquabacter spiritensis TaxID=933073 RepID=A0A4R3M1G9_9HYPH|nr:aldehyde dehydrogenase family protein [Aquabacter spiritensis]TCT04997.1 succinate-semialdehyde dehydrogenase/glutarate-semialdehyde dehydrogenase [Aquabacter spiritensis]